jgi:hypothetical protein
MCAEWNQHLKDVFPVPHEILQVANSNDVAVKAVEQTQTKSEQIIKDETMK